MAIVFDDAHWADEASLEFISFLARRIEELPVLLVVGTRPASDQGRAVLSGLTTDPAALVLRPSPLTRESVDDWVRTVLSNEADTAFVDACHASTSGIPFLVHELLREVASERLQPTAAEARRVGALTPGGVSAVVGLRMANMPSGAVDLARAVAVLGDGVGVGTAAALTDLDEDGAATAAAALVRAGIVESRNGLSFTHPVVRATVYEGMGPGERSAAHARAAALLRSRLATPDQIAAHLLLTDPSDEPDVVTTLTTAARRAADIGALDTARAYLERALEEPPVSAVCAGVLTDLGRVEGMLGVETATQRLEQAMDVADGLGARAEAALELGRVLKFAGEGVRGVEVLHPFVQRADELDPELLEIIKLEYFGLGWLSSGARHRLGPELIDQPDPGEPKSDLDAFVLAAIGFNAAAWGESAELAGDRAARAIASERTPADPAHGGYGTLLAGVALMWADRYGEAERQMDRMLREGRRSGNRLAYISGSAMFGLLNMRRGALLDADRDAIAAIELGMEMHRPDAFLTAAYATHGDIGVDRGLPPDQLRQRLAFIEDSRARRRRAAVRARAATRRDGSRSRSAIRGRHRGSARRGPPRGELGRGLNRGCELVAPVARRWPTARWATGRRRRASRGRTSSWRAPSVRRARWDGATGAGTCRIARGGGRRAARGGRRTRALGRAAGAGPRAGRPRARDRRGRRGRFRRRDPAARPGAGDALRSAWRRPGGTRRATCRGRRAGAAGDHRRRPARAR